MEPMVLVPGRGSGGRAGVLSPTRIRGVPPVPRPRRTLRKRPGGGGPPPPPESGSGDGGGGRGDDRGGRPDERPDASAFALGLALAGITTLFLVLLAVWLLLLRRAPGAWSGLDSPPHALWVSTSLLAASSVALVRATRRAPASADETAARRLGWSLALGVLFLVSQGLLWARLANDGLLPSSGAYGAVFYALTGLHALHVLVGIGLLASLWLRVRRKLAPARARVRLCATYWHFMGGLWLVLFACLYFGR